MQLPLQPQEVIPVTVPVSRSVFSKTLCLCLFLFHFCRLRGVTSSAQHRISLCQLPRPTLTGSLQQSVLVITFSFMHWAAKLPGESCQRLVFCFFAKEKRLKTVKTNRLSPNSKYFPAVNTDKHHQRQQS